MATIITCRKCGRQYPSGTYRKCPRCEYLKQRNAVVDACQAASRQLRRASK